MKEKQNHKGVDKETIIESATKEALFHAQQEIEKYKNHCEELNSA